MYTTVYDGKIIGASAFAIVQWIGFIFVYFVFFVVNDFLCQVALQGGNCASAGYDTVYGIPYRFGNFYSTFRRIGV